MSYVLDLLRRSRRLFVTLMKVMLPVMIAVQIAEHLGWVDALGHAIGPAMGLLNLPPEAGLIWVTGVFVGVYGAIAAMIGLAASLEMTAGQLSALCAMVLFAHALPVEQAIVRRAGASFWATAALRLGVAIVYGGAVAWFSAWSGMLTEPVSLAWLQGSGASTGADAGADAGVAALIAWLQGTAFSLAITFAIIVGLLVLLDLLERSGITPRITAALTPLLKFSGLESRAAPVTTVGVLLGLSYGGALIIDEAERQQFTARTRFLALSWLSLSHSLIEDTALLVALGADIWIVLVGRVLVTLLVVAALARLLDGGDRAAARLAAQAS
ncbi:MAG TPA: nucleoside recognition domain-containing protein [Burkholderiaceae bacterium]|nr:nucleoside recognition domain-containing protein [Burkholderiaceae bacterium]